MSKGCVYLVGAGPGDPGLITVRGKQLLEQADIVIYDYLASPRLLAHAKLDAELIYVGKKAGAHTLKQDEINDLLVARASEGATIVRLKGGDPYVFGRGGEEALDLVDAGIDFEVVPGVTAGVAAPAYAGIPVTHRKMASNFGLITGHETPDKEGSDLDYEALARWKGTLGFYMGVRNLGPICENLISHGLDAETPAAIIRWGTTARQRVLTATVADLPARAEEEGFKPPSIILIGKVVSLREKLNWFEKRPLFGRRIVVTRARSQASRLTARIEALGAEAVEMPAIRIAPPADPAPLDAAVADLASFNWIIFTSANGVAGFFDALAQADLDSRALHAARICTIGPVTAERLGQFGLKPDLQPDKFVSTEIVKALSQAEDLAGVKILCPRADIAPPEMIEALTEAGADVCEVAAYSTVPDGTGAEYVGHRLEQGELHWITFTSSSTVKNFFSFVDPGAVQAAEVRLASIGPATSATLVEQGFQPDVEAETHTIDGLVEAILSKEKEEDTDAEDEDVEDGAVEGNDTEDNDAEDSAAENSDTEDNDAEDGDVEDDNVEDNDAEEDSQ